MSPSSPWRKSDYAKKGYSHRFSCRTSVGNKGIPRARIGWQSPFFVEVMAPPRLAASPQSAHEASLQREPLE